MNPEQLFNKLFVAEYVGDALEMVVEEVADTDASFEIDAVTAIEEDAVALQEDV